MSNLGFTDNTVEAELRDHCVYASVTKGTSMRPLFKTNRDVIILVSADGDLRKYDVVLYKNNSGKYVLHRIVKVLPDKYVLRGDNTFVNEYVSKDRIIAVLTEFNRKGKKKSVNDIGYRFYSRFWCGIYPIRFLSHKAFTVMYRAFRFVFKKKRMSK